MYSSTLSVRRCPTQSTGNCEDLDEHFQRMKGVALILDEIYFLPPGHLVGVLAGVAVTPQLERGYEPHEAGVGELKRTTDVVGCLLGVSLLCAFFDGSEIASRHVRVVIDAIAAHHLQNIQTPAVGVSQAVTIL